MFRRFFFRDTVYILKSKYRQNNTNRSESKHGGRKLGIVFLIIFAGLMYLSFQLFDDKIKPTVIAMAEARAKVIATYAINESINEEIVNKIKYEDLITIRKNEKGEVTAVQSNTPKMNEMQALTSQVVQHKIENLDTNDLRIPIGNIMNSSLLSGLGPRLKIKILPIGTIQSKFQDEFITAGINQTKHKISLEVNCRVSIIAPFISTQSDVLTSIPVAETIIIGGVPTTYIDMRETSNPETREKAWSIAPNLAK